MLRAHSHNLHDTRPRCLFGKKEKELLVFDAKIMSNTPWDELVRSMSQCLALDFILVQYTERERVTLFRSYRLAHQVVS